MLQYHSILQIEMPDVARARNENQYGVRRTSIAICHTNRNKSQMSSPLDISSFAFTFVRSVSFQFFVVVLSFVDIECSIYSILVFRSDSKRNIDYSLLN